MNSQIKQQWATALRSGKYTQDTGSLQTEKGFCCLGVLCDLYSKETGIEWEVSYTIDQETCHLPRYSFNTETAFLPVEVKEWAGLESRSPIVKSPEDELKELAILNDNGSTFEEIAQLIEGGF